MKKLICIDVDGTLVHGEYKVTKSIREALDKCDAEKVIVSGRTVEELLKLETGYDLIGSNGGEIYANGKYVKSEIISNAEAIELINELNNFGYYAIVHTKKGVYIQKDSHAQVMEELEKILVKYNLEGKAYKERLEFMFNHVYGRSHKVDDLIEFVQNNQPSINKLESHFELDKTKFFEYLNGNYNVEVFNSAGSNIEIAPQNALKSTAIREYANSSETYIISIGDGNNDIPMFEVSDYSIAMGNATTKLKKLADHVVSPGEEGFIEALNIVNTL
ncbi:MAG: HAD-IIB family hydrolase [Bacilli bacterium]